LKRVIVLPGGGYAQHVAHEGEPVVGWLNGLGVRAAGVAPIPASSGNTQRQRLDQGGNRQINAALHRVIVTRARCHPATQDYITRRQAEGKTTREAIRCLKRYLARHVWRLLQPPPPDRGTPPSPSIS